MAGTLKALAGPAFLSTSAADVYNLSSALIYTTIRHVHLANVSAVSCWFTLCIGATGVATAGTEWFKQVNIPPNSYLDYFPARKLVSTNFLTGLAQTVSSIVYDIEGEQVVV
jgi:hypothetical protein